LVAQFEIQNGIHHSNLDNMEAHFVALLCKYVFVIYNTVWLLLQVVALVWTRYILRRHNIWLQRL